MAYNVKYRLDYCNGKLQNARLDIEVDGYSGVINQIEATPEPFILKYNSEKGDRSGYFHTTEATIKVYQDDKFNIDDLLTSDETAIRVKFYIENSIYWVGFVLPDFYEVEIGSSPVVTMVATDRIGTLKNQTIKRDNDSIGSYHRMIEKSLAKTGLNLPIQSLISFNLSSEPTRDFLQNTGGQWLRVDDDMEGSVSAYEVIRSILVLANATLFQRNGKWHIQNKLEFESRSATKSIDKINTGGSRMINPPAQEVGVFSEFAGGRKYPNNYNFDSLVGWSAFGGFNARIENREVIGFSNGIPIYGGVSENRSLANNNPISTAEGFHYLQSNAIRVISARADVVAVNFDINITMFQGDTTFADVYAKKGDQFKLLTKDGFIDANETDAFSYARLRLRGEGDYNKNKLETTTFSFSGVIEEEEESENSVNEWTVYVRIMGNLDGNTTTFVNFAYVTFDSNIKQQGNIFKVKQGVNFTKNQEIDTTIFGDRIRKGINGYFYNYPIDEKSIQFAKIGSVYESLGLGWITPFDSTPEPLLLHSARQRAIMFSAPHNIINATVEGQFDAYDVYDICGKKYVMVEAVYDFFRNETQLKIEEVKYDNTEKTDYVYSYFGGENTENIKGVSSISGSGTSSGGGRGLIKQDENGNYYSEQPFYSLGGLSAFGFSEVGDGNGGGGVINVINNLTSTSATDALSANMGRYLKSLIDSIDVGDIDLTNYYTKVETYSKTEVDNLINGVGVGGGGGLIKEDSEGNYYSQKNFYSLGGLSAYGFSEEGSEGGGGIVNILPSWANYTSDKSGWALSAGLGVDLNTRKADKTWVESLLEDYVPTDTKYTAGRGLTLTDNQFSTSFDIANYATVTALGNKVDKVTGKSLISDTEIARLSSVTNQDLSPYALKTYVDTEVGKKWTYSEATIKAVKVSNAFNSDTVNGFTVGVDVPDNAIFTDTIVDISGKVDKVTGKGLSTNDFTTAEKNKLATLENQTRESLGVENVTNESKLTMFANPTFTGTTKVTILELDSNWKFVKVGDNIELQYNGVTKQIMTNNGDIIATAGVTAYQ